MKERTAPIIIGFSGENYSDGEALLRLIREEVRNNLSQEMLAVPNAYRLVH